jgi:hypothetical protein
VRDVVQFFRANPQAAILLAIVVVLGFGTLIAVLFASVGTGSGGANNPANDGGVIMLGHLLGALTP